MSPILDTVPEGSERRLADVESPPNLDMDTTTDDTIAMDIQAPSQSGGLETNNKLNLVDLNYIGDVGLPPFLDNQSGIPPFLDNQSRIPPFLDNESRIPPFLDNESEISHDTRSASPCQQGNSELAAKKQLETSTTEHKGTVSKTAKLCVSFDLTLFDDDDDSSLFDSIAAVVNEPVTKRYQQTYISDKTLEDITENLNKSDLQEILTPPAKKSSLAFEDKTTYFHNEIGHVSNNETDKASSLTSLNIYQSTTGIQKSAVLPTHESIFNKTQALTDITMEDEALIAHSNITIASEKGVSSNISSGKITTEGSNAKSVKVAKKPEFEQIISESMSEKGIADYSFMNKVLNGIRTRDVEADAVQSSLFEGSTQVLEISEKKCMSSRSREVDFKRRFKDRLKRKLEGKELGAYLLL